MKEACPSCCLLKQVCPRDPFLALYCILYSPMNFHKLCMKMGVVWELLKMPASSQCSVRNVEGYAAMLMTAPTLYQAKIPCNFQRS